MKAKPKPRVAPAPDQVPLARIKLNFSRYVREVQTRGQAITITNHGRAAAVLAPVASWPRPTLTVREPVDRRPLGRLALRPPPGQGASREAIRHALDEERGE